MDQERERIQADLKGLLHGDVYCDDVHLQMYASDASIYEIRPLAVVRPRGPRDVAATVRYAADQEIPIHARGAGTGLAGESLGPGIVIDFSYSMTRIIEFDGDEVRVQPGVVYAHLNRFLKRHNRVFGPDPSTGPVSTMGSVIALDGAGSRWLKYGSARQHVERLRVVLADGSLTEFGKHELVGTPPIGEPESEERRSMVKRAEIVHRVSELIRRESSLLDNYYPGSLVNRCGYNLQNVLQDNILDLAKVVVGSEGTLALITEAVLKTSPLPSSRGIALLFFDRLDLAAQAAQVATSLGASACDLLDRRLLTIARDTDTRYERLLPKDAEAMLLVEFQGDTPSEIRDQLQQTVHRLTRKKRLAFAARSTMEMDEMEDYWRLVRRVVPVLYRLEGSIRPLPFVEDIAVPPAELPAFLVRLQNVLKSHQVTASLFGHAGHGQLHVRPFLDLADPLHVRKMQDLATDIYAEVQAADGTISGEHGDGLSRTWFVHRQYGPLYDVFGDLKRIFDPQNTLNPGKVVADVPQPLTKNLRPVVANGLGDSGTVDGGESHAGEVVARDSGSDVGSSVGTNPTAAETSNGDESTPTSGPLLELQLAWNQDQLAYTARSCNGCGRCRGSEPELRMCPIFRFSPSEAASPRAKANIVRGVLTGRLDAQAMSSDEFKACADLCVNCHQCRMECPATVDIPKLMVEAKAQYVITNGLHWSDWFLTHLDLLAQWGSLFRPLTNWGLGNRQMRWLLARVAGIAQGRKLPRLAHRSFLRSAHRRRLTRPSRGSSAKVIYFIDVFANWFDVEVANALVAILEHNGISVFVPTDQLPSGMASISVGALEHAKRLAAHNVSILAEAIRQGYHVVATEPSAALALQREYPNLLDDDDARLVAANTSEACAFLWQLHQQGQLELDLHPINVNLGYHQPCHSRILYPEVAGQRLLQLIPGLTVRHLDNGCSGMAGTFGLKKQNYRSSLRAGWGLISALRDPGIQVGSSECSACKMQMEQGSAKPTIHPLKLLALAYGLTPEVARLLTVHGEELILT